MTSITTKTEHTLPHPVLTKLGFDKDPTAFTIRILNREVKANASAIDSTLGGGLHGHLGMVMPDAAYTALAGVAFALPVRPVAPVYHGAASIVANDLEAHKQAVHT